ncbi:hypothetical protein [Pradoshia sp.]
MPSAMLFWCLRAYLKLEKGGDSIEADGGIGRPVNRYEAVRGN